MFELTLSEKIDRQTQIAKIYKNLSKTVKVDGGVIVKHNRNGRSYLVLGVPDSKKEYYKAKILDEILSVILSSYKFNFFLERLPNITSTILYLSFLKAISFFDTESDKEVLKKNIEFSGEILIDSLYYFKLQSLKAKWERTATIILQNSILSSSSSIIEVVRYLTTISNKGTICADIIIGKKLMIIKGIKSKKVFKNNSNGMSNLLSEIVILNPLKINLKVAKSNKNSEILCGYLQNIFEEKIYLMN